jgi:methionyl-tRNA formyltransferase
MAMRIEFITDDNPLYVLPFFEEFFRNYGAEFKIVHVSSCRSMGKRPRRKLAEELFHLYGYIGSLRLAARIASARCLGLLPKSKNAPRFYTLEQLCRAYGVPCQRIDNPNTRQSLAEFESRASDLIVSVACPYILKKELLELPRLGCINIHNAKLPKYKGMMPTFWQMFHGETEIGITVHYMASAIDEGAVLLQDGLKIEPAESLDHLMRRAKRFGALCMARVLRSLGSKTQSVTTVDERQGSYFTFPTIEQIREFRRRGLKAI